MRDLLLNALLDKYERSMAYRSGEPSARRILLKLYDGKGQTDFPFYDISDHDRRMEINATIEELTAQGVLAFEWLRGERAHLIAKVWLPYDQLEQAYRLVGRSPKATTVDSILEQAKRYAKQLNTDWAKQYFEYILQKGNQKRDFGHIIPQEDATRRDLWKVIAYLDAHVDTHVNARPNVHPNTHPNALPNAHPYPHHETELEIVERVFSMRLFADSKRFEQALRSKLLSILRNYLDIDKIYDTDEELLRQIGIVKYPEYFEFCGALTLSNNYGATDFASMSHGSSLNIVDLQTGTLTIPEHIKRILTIENRANYFDYIAKTKEPSELVLYHGGQYSPSKKKFFIAISNVMPKDCAWLHWGDIDLGGFLMLARLRREINPAITPYRMHVTELVTYRPYTRAISGGYADKLRGLQRKAELADCSSCIGYMIEQKIRLEQESML
jgi:hypothetical protein